MQILYDANRKVCLAGLNLTSGSVLAAEKRWVGIVNEIEKATLLSKCHAYLMRYGIAVEIVDDLDTLSEIIVESGKPYFTPMASPAHNDLGDGNSMWLVGRCEGNPVLIGGARLELVGADGIGAFWRRAMRRAYSPVGCGEIFAIDPELDRVVRGSLVYFGDMYASKEYKGGLLGLQAFTTIGHLAVSFRWNPDWTYAFMHERDCMRGADHRYGFSWLVPQPFRWKEPPPTRSNSECCALLSRMDLPKMAARVGVALSNQQ